MNVDYESLTDSLLQELTKRQSEAIREMAENACLDGDDDSYKVLNPLSEATETYYSIGSDFVRTGDFESARTSFRMSLHIADFAAGMIPGVSVAKSLVEAVTGHNYLTGEDLSEFDRAVAVIDVVTMGGFGPVQKIFKVLNTIEGLKSSVKVAHHVFESAGRVFKNGATKDELSQFANLSKKAGSIERAEVLSHEISAFSKELKFTETTAKRMETASRYVPQEILAEAIKAGKEVVDPQGVAGTMKYTSEMFRNGKKYELEVIYREVDKTILHFLYK